MDNVSFAELMRVIPNSAGERMMFTDNDSVIIWGGVSQEFAEAVEDLLREGHIVAKPTTTMVYQADRIVLDFPIATRVGKYKTEHWLPVVLCRA